MKGKIFILEDDRSISSLVKVALEMNGAECSVFSTVRAFNAALEKETPDVALLDVMLPDGSGLDVLRSLKSGRPSVACIVLSALGREEERVNGLNSGADDYVVKPFSVLELTARVNARLRAKTSPRELSSGGLRLYCEERRVTLGGEPLPLNRKEFELLKYFMENEGKALPRERLLTEIWGYEAGGTRTLDNHVARLRKLGIAIQTVFGVGYRFGGGK